MTAQCYKYLSPPSAHTVGILLFTRRISTSLSRIAIHKGLSARCDSTRASRTYTIIFVSWALCGLIVEFIVFHYMIFALGINTIWFKKKKTIQWPDMYNPVISIISGQHVLMPFVAGNTHLTLHGYNCRYTNFREGWDLYSKVGMRIIVGQVSCL